MQQALATLIGNICDATRSPIESVTFNLEEQRCWVQGNTGRMKVIKRTVYRVRWEGNQLIGNLFVPKAENQRPVYQFDFDERLWKQRK